MTDARAEEMQRRCQYECKSRCCRYITVVLPAPKRKADLDELSWFLAHENVSVYVEARRWHLEVQTPCRYLGSDNLCAVYEDRPEVCRDYEHDICEYPNRPRHALQFDTRESFDEWLEKRQARRRRQRRRASRSSAEG